MTTHPSPAVIARYADPGADLDEVTAWSVETHLEACPDCRALVAPGLPDSSSALLARITAGIDDGITAGPAPAPAMTWAVAHHRWLVWSLAPWLVMTVTALACAVVLQTLWPSLPSLVALLAPVAPLPGVAVAWSRRHDPAWELIAGTPAAGLTMLLRRTAGVLAVVVPALVLASGNAGVSLALTLLPCLTFTAATVALGAVVGVRRAAVSLGVVWTAAVVLPALLTLDVPPVLQPASAPFWVLTTLVLAAFAAARSGAYRRLSSHL